MLSSTILLDLKRNRYFGVGQKETQALSTLACNWSDATLHASGNQTMPPEAALPIAEALLKAGLLSREAPAAPSPRTGHIELDGMLMSVGDEINRAGTLRAAHVFSFARALLWAWRALRSRNLYSIVCELGERKAAAEMAFDEERAIELVGIFRRLRPHAFAARDRCLFHALALVKFLSEYNVYPTWVIGVRAKPWGAHSWVQQGALLLDANPEQICEYAPILIV